MKTFSEILEAKTEPRKIPKHAKAASVDSILEVAPLTKNYSYVYWLAKIGKATYGEVLEIVKKAKDVPAPYSKGGFIANRLDELNGRKAKPRTAPKISFVERKEK